MRTRWIAAAAAVLCAAGSGCGGGGATGETRKTFVVPHVLESKGRISSAAAGDIDGDGVPDLVLHDPSSASLGVLFSSRLRESPTLPSKGATALARGKKGYDHYMALGLWASGGDCAICDVDGDGCPDLVVAGGAANEVAVFRCDPENRRDFLTPLIVEVPFPADRVACGDLDGDGRPDVVALDESTGAVSLLLQSSSLPLAFAPGKGPAPVGACFGLVCCDLDCDGALDLVTNQPDLDRVLVLFGGAAGFVARDYPSGLATGKRMAVGDVDGDGFPDCVVLAEGGRSVVCLHQVPKSPGEFEQVVSPLPAPLGDDDDCDSVACALARPPSSCASSIAIDEPGVHRVGITVNEEGVRSPAACLGQAGLALCDLDRDGRLDIVSRVAGGPDEDEDCDGIFGSSSVAGGFGPTSERVQAGLAQAGSAVASGAARTTGAGPVLAVCDLDCDGHVDLVRCDPASASLALLYVVDAAPPGPPEYALRLRESPTRPSRGLRVHDMDCDGIPDVVLATDAGLQVFFRDAAGQLGPPLVLAQGQSFVAVAIGDVDGDGLPDCVACTSGQCAAIRRSPAGAREFLPPVLFPPPPPGGPFLALELGDVDGDGNLDCVAIRESPSKASLGRGQGNGFFDVFTEIDCAVPDPADCALEDLDGDGRCDLAVCGSDVCAVVRQMAPLKWAPPELILLQGGDRIEACDLDGDGRCDLVVCGHEGVHVAQQSGAVRGRFLSSYSLSTEACGGLAVCDLDRDGAFDVCWVELASGDLVCRTATASSSDADVVRLNGLPPGIPVGRCYLEAEDCDDDDRFDLWVACPDASSGALGTLLQEFSPLH